MSGVFISYSHDSQDLEKEVRRFADLLIEYGVQTEIDQYTPNPVQGWPQYMIENISKSDYILCICTESYKKKFENREDIKSGLDKKFEGKYIKQILYSNEENKKIIPILFSNNDSIPLELKSYTCYKLYEKGEFEKLYRCITNQPNIRKPQLGKVIQLAENNNDVLSNIIFGYNDKLIINNENNVCDRHKEDFQNIKKLCELIISLNRYEMNAKENPDIIGASELIYKIFFLNKYSEEDFMTKQYNSCRVSNDIGEVYQKIYNYDMYGCHDFNLIKVYRIIVDDIIPDIKENSEEIKKDIIKSIENILTK